MKRGCAVVAVLVVLAVASLWIEHRSAVTLPQPTGPFAVGRTIADWRGETFDPLAPPATKRELLAWIWYPTDDRSAPVDDYLPPSIAAARRTGSFSPFRLLTRDASTVRCHSRRGAALSPREAKYPVVIFRGGASSEVVNYSTLTEDLASHGYVVVGIDAPYRTTVVVFPDGRVARRSAHNDPERVAGGDQQRMIEKLCAAWTSDMSFALDRLAQWPEFSSRIDVERAGAFGHSFGGAQSLQFCHDDRRCKAAVDVDGLPLGGVITTGVGKPVLFILSDHTGDDTRERTRVMADIDRLGGRRVVIAGANHFTFSDDGALLKSGVLRTILRLFGRLRIEPRRQLALTAANVREFFDAELKQRW